MKDVHAIERFRTRLVQEWLTPFCRSRRLDENGFVWSSLDRLTAIDAADFMHAIDRGLVTHLNGSFMAPRSKAKEQLFWEGARNTSPRRLTLWLEPVITIAALGRLHREHGWPANRLGLQSATWAFDLVGYQGDLAREQVVCEVKKSDAEVRKLMGFMTENANTATDMATRLKGAELNAFRKVLALRQSDCLVFWALGPGGAGSVFNVIRSSTGVHLLPATESQLCVGPNA